MEILFLHRAISKHYIRDEANDKDNQGQEAFVDLYQFKVSQYKHLVF